MLIKIIVTFVSGLAIGLVTEIIFRSVKNRKIIKPKFINLQMYGLTAQMRRSAISIPSNIAEGAARSSKKEFIQFLYISLGSLSELEIQMIIANKLEYLLSLDLELLEKLEEKLLNFIKYIKNNDNPLYQISYLRMNAFTHLRMFA